LVRNPEKSGLVCPRPCPAGLRREVGDGDGVPGDPRVSGRKAGARLLVEKGEGRALLGCSELGRGKLRWAAGGEGGKRGAELGLLAARERGEGKFGPSGQERGRGFVLFLFFYFPFFYSKAIFKAVLKITLNYF